MNLISFILSLLETPIGHLNWADREFLYEIVEGYSSAYAMNKRHKIDYEKEKLKDPDTVELIKPKAYININKRFRKYHRLGILEEETKPGGFDHGARNYRVSDKGLVFLFLDVIHPEIHENFRNFSKSKLFQTFILPYFESKTIEQYTLPLAKFIEYYLEDICNKINNALNPELLEEYQYNPKLPLSQQPNLEKDETYEDYAYTIYPIYNLLIQLETAHKSLILDIVSMNEKILKNHVPYPTGEDRRKTVQLLSKDKIFMNEFKKIKTDIDNSYNKLLNV